MGAERVDGVLTTRRGEPARRRSQRRDHVSVQLDGANQKPRRSTPCRTGSHCLRLPAPARVRSSANLSSCSSRAEIACLLLGRARITILSPAASSSRTSRATWRSLRETLCRTTALPTDLATTSPILGASEAGSSTR